VTQDAQSERSRPQAPARLFITNIEINMTIDPEKATTNPESAAVRRGTGKWAQAGVPHKGWTCVDTDENEDMQTCEMCEVMSIRYIHIMQHPDYPDVLEVGCVCAENMEGDYVGPRRREAKLKQRQRWIAREWRESRAGNEYLNARGFNVVVFPRGTRWGARVEDRETGMNASAELTTAARRRRPLRSTS
jgi:hypothetical protein